MRLGTMDDSDIYSEMDGGVQADASMPVAIPSPVHEGEIEEGEMVEGEERDQEDENEIPTDEIRGVEDALSAEVQPQQPPPVAKPSFRPLWRRSSGGAVN